MNIILKFPVISEKKQEKDDEFDEWEEENELMMIKLNIGLHETKWIKLLKFMTT